VHPSFAEELAHARINQWITRLASRPALKANDCRLVVIDREMIEVALQISPRRLGVVPENVSVKLSPANLGREDATPRR
jgi:hypothetical protein